MPDPPSWIRSSCASSARCWRSTRTVPDSYPLSLNSLRTACNQYQPRSRGGYDEATVVDALNRLATAGLVRFVKPTGVAVVKYHQRLEEQPASTRRAWP